MISSDENLALPLKRFGQLGLRPGEARALEVPDYRDGWISVNKAVKGKFVSSPIRGTKSGRPKRLPVGEELKSWIEQNVDLASRLERAPLFRNPRTGKRYAHKSLQRIRRRLCVTPNFLFVSLYEGTKHSFATDAIRRGVPERLLQKFLGHAHPESTRRYARLADNAVLEVLPVRRQTGDKALETNQREVAEFVVGPPGLEPGTNRL